MPTGGPYDSYSPGWCPQPLWWTNPAPDASPSRVTTGVCGVGSVWPGYPYYVGDPPLQTPTSVPRLTIEEQLGVDPISKLAAAIEKLADALKESK